MEFFLLVLGNLGGEIDKAENLLRVFWIFLWRWFCLGETDSFLRREKVLCLVVLELEESLRFLLSKRRCEPS